MNTPTPEINHTSMDAKKQVALTMLEIQEITYHLEKALTSMEAGSDTEGSEDSGVHNEKSVMLQQIIDKLQH